MKSKTKIGKQTQRKSNSELVETIMLSKKHPGWIKVAEILSGSHRKHISINLKDLDEKIKDGETVVIPGKILSQGDLTKKASIIALGFSEQAKDKLLKQKIKINYINEEIKKNPSAKGLNILTREVLGK